MADEAHGHGHGGGLGKPKPATLGKLLLALTLLLFMMQLMEWVAAGVGTEEQEEEQLHHYGIFLLLLLLIMGLIIGWFLDIKSISWMPEAGACLLIGVVAGGVLELNGSHEGENGHRELEKVFKFDTEFFFLFLLPPIILESGFNMNKMQRRKLFQNIGAVCGFAFVGTLVSTFVIAMTMYAAGGWAPAVPDGAAQGEGMSVLESLVFGSLISATDPVTVLAIFGKLGADRDLYALVFGESVLNDAVAIVLYKTFSTFNPHSCETPDCSERTGSTMESVGSAFATFLQIFLGSLFVGCFIAAISSLVFKHTALYKEEYFVTENVLLIVFPYMAWMLAESLELSGIVAILFCGFGMSQYTMLNLSDATKEATQQFFRVMAFGCETFVFIYMGLAMFTFKSLVPYATVEDGDQYNFVPLTLVAVGGMLASRVLNVYPISFLVNLVRPARRKVSRNIQNIVWFSGLRGGIAFALALEARREFACRVPTCWFSEHSHQYVSAEWFVQGRYNNTPEQVLEHWESTKCELLLNDKTVPCNNEAEGMNEECECPASHTGAGGVILTITLLCVLFTVICVGGSATSVMTAAGVIGISSDTADLKQRQEEQEDYAIMMAARKDSKTLSVNKLYIQPFLTWKGTNSVRDPLRLAHEAAAREAADILGTSITGGGHEGGQGSFVVDRVSPP